MYDWFCKIYNSRSRYSDGNETTNIASLVPTFPVWERSPAIISLTKQGDELAKKLVKLMNSAEHLHCPKPFAKIIQAKFQAQTPLIFITATGIAVRTLAPIIQNKTIDPPVLVIDQNGQFVIPLLSGHEGGANRWAKHVSHLLKAQTVITTARSYTELKLVIGMGCDRGCPIELLQNLLTSTLKKINSNPEEITAIASIDLKQNEKGLIQLADNLGVPLVCYSAEKLRTVEDQLSQKSDIVFREVGVYGVAEAAALVYAQEQQSKPLELTVPKQKNKRATCAIVSI